MARKLYRLGRFTAHHRWIVTAAWIAAVIVLAASFRAFGANTSNNLELPGTDSQEATDLLAERFPPQQNGKNPIVFHAASGKVTDADEQAGDPGLRAGDQEAARTSTARRSPFGQQAAPRRSARTSRPPSSRCCSTSATRRSPRRSRQRSSTRRRARRARPG